MHEVGSHPGRRPVGCFFTRGVDSWYSVLNGTAENLRSPPSSTAPRRTSSSGARPAARARELRAASSALVREAAEQVGLPAGHDRQQPCGRWWSRTGHWGYLARGGCLAEHGARPSASHLARVHIASTLRLGQPRAAGRRSPRSWTRSGRPSGPRWCTTEPRWTRTEKLRFLASHPRGPEAPQGVHQREPPRELRRLREVRSDDGRPATRRGTRQRPGVRRAPQGPETSPRIVPRYKLEWAFHREMGPGPSRDPGKRQSRRGLPLRERRRAHAPADREQPNRQRRVPAQDQAA